MMERHLSAAIQMGDYKTGVKSEAFLIQLDRVQYVLHSASQYRHENLSQDDQKSEKDAPFDADDSDRKASFTSAVKVKTDFLFVFY